MADVRPFRGLRYDPQRAGDPAAALAPPYDVISPTQEAELRERSPYNVVRLELPQGQPSDTPGDDRYTRAAALFQKWIEEGILAPEPRPAMYLVQQEYVRDGQSRRNRALLGAVRIEEFDKGVVMPHESTTPAPKADRLALMRVARANFSPIMTLYDDSKGSVAHLLDGVTGGEPVVRDRQAGITAWVIDEPELLQALQKALSPLQLFIADGHHRYETALRYRDTLAALEGALHRNAAARFMMMGLISMDDPGLLVLPYHRMIGGLTGDELGALNKSLGTVFHVETMDVPRGSAAAAAKVLEERLASSPAETVVVATVGLEPSTAHILTLRDSHVPSPDAPALERCDMWILHQQGIRAALGAEREDGTISFVHDSEVAVESVQDRKSQVAFLLRPLPMTLFQEVVGKGERLPPKSTYFYPKMPTGIVINHLVGELPGV